MTDDEVYQTIFEELDKNELVGSTWVKAFELADGDENRAKAKYISFRFKKIKEELESAEEVNALTQEENKIISRIEALARNDSSVSSLSALKYWYQNKYAGNEKLTDEQLVKIIEISRIRDGYSPITPDKYQNSKKNDSESDGVVYSANKYSFNPDKPEEKKPIPSKPEIKSSEIDLEVSDRISHNGFFSKLPMGDYGLAKSYWIFGVLILLPFNVAFRFIETVDLIFILSLIIFYEVMVNVGIWRAANKYMGLKIWSIISKVLVVIGFAYIILFSFFVFELFKNYQIFIYFTFLVSGLVWSIFLCRANVKEVSCELEDGYVNNPINGLILSMSIVFLFVLALTSYFIFF